jgi:hypothetical protein
MKRISEKNKVLYSYLDEQASKCVFYQLVPGVVAFFSFIRTFNHDNPSLSSLSFIVFVISICIFIYFKVEENKYRRFQHELLEKDNSQSPTNPQQNP